MRRPSRSLVISATLFVCVVGAAGFAVRHSIWRSDSELKHHFLAHKADFEKLVGMSQEDVHLQRIAPDFTWLDNSVAWPRKNVGISEQRWDEYRRLFRSVGVSVGINKDIDHGRVFFPIVSEGLAPSGYTKGLVYSPTPLGPVLDSLDKAPPKRYWERDHVLAYKRIQDHWYIYFEQW